MPNVDVSAAKEKNRRKRKTRSVSGCELRLEMARNAIANAVYVSIASSFAFLAVENNNAARNALENINRNAFA